MQPTISPAHSNTTQNARRAAAVAAALFLVSLAVYLSFPQRAFFGDGLPLLHVLERGELRSQYLFYLPMVQSVQWVASLVSDLSLEAALKLTSVLGGAGGVVVWFFVALEVFKTLVPAAAAASILIFMPGYWFFATATQVSSLHACFAGVLFWGFLQFLRNDRSVWRGSVAVAFGTLFSLSTHLSACSNVFIAIGVLLYTQRKLTLLAAGGAGVAAFLFFDMWGHTLIFGDSSYRGEVLSFYLQSLERFDAVGLLTVISTIGLDQLLIYTLPASILVPAGLSLCWKNDRPLAVAIVLWVFGYLVVGAPFGVIEWGRYFVPTMGLQAILAVTVIRHLATPVWAAILLVILPIAPVCFAAHYYMTAALWTILGISVLLAIAVRFLKPSPTRFVTIGAPFALAIITGITSLSTVVSSFPIDVLRDQIDAVSHYTGGKGLLVICERYLLCKEYWYRYFNPARRTIPLNLLELDFLADDQATNRRDYFTAEIERHLSSGDPVWLAGNLLSPKPGGQSEQYLQFLRTHYRVMRPNGAPEALLQIQR